MKWINGTLVFNDILTGIVSGEGSEILLNFTYTAQDGKEVQCSKIKNSGNYLSFYVVANESYLDVYNNNTSLWEGSEYKTISFSLTGQDINDEDYNFLISNGTYSPLLYVLKVNGQVCKIANGSKIRYITINGVSYSINQNE